jgi:hypothetical protein
VLVPWSVKLPLEAAAIILVAGLAVMIFQRSPELQREVYAPVPASAPSHPSETGAPPLDRAAPDAASPPKVEERGGATATTPPSATAPTPAATPAPAPAPAPFTAPSGPSSTRAPIKEGARQDAGPPAAETGKGSNAARDAMVSTEPQRKAKLAESPPLGAASQEGAAKREPAARAESGLEAATEAKKDVADERTRQAAPAPAVPVPVAPHSSATARAETQAARAMQKSAEVQRLAAVPPPGSQARLPVTDPVAAERTVRDLVARASGQVTARVEDGAAIILSLAVPPDRWDELKRSLENLGALRLEPRPEEGARFVRLTLRLER